MEVVPLILDAVDKVSSLRILVPTDLVKEKNKKQVKEALRAIVKQFGNKIPLIHPVIDMKIKDEKLEVYINQRISLKEKKRQLLNEMPENYEMLYAQYNSKHKIQKQISEIEDNIYLRKKLVLKDNLVSMKRVLRRLGFINKEDLVEAKGKVSCIVSACDEIMITEMLFSGIFNDLEPGQLASLLSALIFDERKRDEQVIEIKDPTLRVLYNKMEEITKKIYQVYEDSKIPGIKSEDYIKAMNPGLMLSTQAWCQGKTFLDICAIGEGIFEGNIIRCLRRLDELLRQVSEACEVIGNSVLKDKFVDAQNLLNRGIIFAASLYL